MQICDILPNSIVINELNGSEIRNSEMSNVLLGVSQNVDGIYAVRSIISKLSNNITEFDVFRLGVVKGKKQRPLIPLSSAARLLQSKALSSPRDLLL